MWRMMKFPFQTIHASPPDNNDYALLKNFRNALFGKLENCRQSLEKAVNPSFLPPFPHPINHQNHICKMNKAFSSTRFLATPWIMSTLNGKKKWRMMYSSWRNFHKSRISPQPWLYFMFFSWLFSILIQGISLLCMALVCFLALFKLSFARLAVFFSAI
jgi:hypothetical protein